MTTERARDRDPKPLADLLRTFVAGRGWGERMALGKLRDSWDSIVGGTVATRSEPLRLQQGVLTVRVEGGAWSAELTLLAGSILERAETFLGPGSVRDVKVVSGRSRDA